jgi:hypothetical protein
MSERGRVGWSMEGVRSEENGTWRYPGSETRGHGEVRGVVCWLKVDCRDIPSSLTKVQRDERLGYRTLVHIGTHSITDGKPRVCYQSQGYSWSVDIRSSNIESHKFVTKSFQTIAQFSIKLHIQHTLDHGIKPYITVV